MTNQGMLVMVWGCAEGISVIYCSHQRHARRCIHTSRNCFNNIPFPTEACAEVYPYPPKLFQQLTMTNQGIPVMVWGCAKGVSVIYYSQRRHARRCMHTCWNCLNNLPFPTEACVEVYLYPPKLFRQFTMINWGMPVRVWGCAKGVSVIYSSQRRHARSCIHTCQNCFNNLPFPTKACAEVYPYPPKLFQKFTMINWGMPGDMFCGHNGTMWNFMPPYSLLLSNWGCGCHKAHNKLFTS
jgi:hypothetical protein